MRHIKPYREQSDLCNESIRSFLKPKSEDDVKKALGSMKNSEEKLRHIKRYKLDNLFTKEEIRNLLLNGNHMIEDLIRFLTYDPFYDALTEDDINTIRTDFKYMVYDIEEPGEQLYFIEEYDQLGFFDSKEIKEIESNIKEDSYGDHVHESIRQHLKPKSEEDIEDAIKHLTPTQKIYRGCEINYLDLVKRGIEEGGNPTKDHGVDDYPIWLAVIDGHIDIVKFLLDDDRVLSKAVKDGDIDHFIEVVNNEYNDPKWIEYISKRIDKLKDKK